ncbi:potassium transporter TrkG [Deinococcus deserti]|uniref:Uncharacterized protein n=1 Tax=Deinococcus deserti (strain DSM 17065 / CIP 109153 / LMG 22923 / VCD115) TaxID=546414 RepID=C1D3M4_DEIDV|nr:potassium transporter TrkG [Deinococcus deserti]ACO48103.1 Hypothetical protein; putative membrane protein [Deinococcus deserti VCD115]
MFHSVSAFNNAGFGLYPDNMIRFAEDPLVLLTTSTLVILGGLGYLAVLGVALYLRDPHRNRLSLNTIIILVTSASLVVLRTVVAGEQQHRGGGDSALRYKGAPTGRAGCGLRIVHQ